MAHGLRTSLLVLIGAGVLGWALPRHILREIMQGIQTIFRRLVVAAGRRRRIFLLLIWMVALIPMIYLTFLVRHYGVNAPTFDDWAMAPLIVKAHSGQLTVADIFQQQQEARTVLPNLIFILSAHREWNVRDQMVVSVLSCWLTAAAVFILLRRSGLNLAATAICLWLTVLTIFSAAQFELWIFASGFPSFLLALFLATALVVIGTRWRTSWKFSICVILAAASSFTLPHGLLVWGLTFPALLIAEPIPRRRFWFSLWLIAAALCATIYFWGYTKPAYLPEFAPAASALEYIRFILEFLGGGLAYSLNHRPAIAATIFGMLQLALLMVALICISKRWRDHVFILKAIPWFAFAFYSLGSASLAALGRVGYGASYALASRYVPFSMPLTLAVIGLTALIMTDFLKGHSSPRARRWGTTICVLLIIAYLGPYKICAGNTLFFLRGYSANDRLVHGAILFSGVIDASVVIKRKIFPPGADFVVQNAAALDQLRLLRPRLVQSSHLNALPHEIADGRSVAGACEAMIVEGDSYRVLGWALLKAKGRPADCVVISSELLPGEPIVFAISDSIEMRWDIARQSWPNDYLWAGWSVTFPRSAVPANAKLGFWAVDADESRLYRLEDGCSSTR